MCFFVLQPLENFAVLWYNINVNNYAVNIFLLILHYNSKECIMKNAYATVQKTSKIIFLLGLILVGALFAVFGGFAAFGEKAEYAQTDATVMSTRNEYDEFQEMFQDYATVEYVVDGVTYTGEISCSDTTESGDIIVVQYNVADPNEVSLPGGEWVPYLFFGLGVVIVAIGVVLAVKTLSDKSTNAQFDQVDTTNVPQEEVARIANSNEQSGKYLFYFAGKLNQGYVLADENHTQIIVAECEKVQLFKPTHYTLTDNRTGNSTEHDLGHTTTISYGFNNVSIPTNSSFKIDGKDCWQFLADMGYSLEPHLQGITLNFDVKHYGVPVAFVRSAGSNILPQRQDKQSKLGNIPTQGLYRIDCPPSELEAVFWVCVIISRVEFFAH